MLYTKFQGNRPIGSSVEEAFFSIYGRGGHVGNVTRTVQTISCLHLPQALEVIYEIWLKSVQCSREEEV